MLQPGPILAIANNASTSRLENSISFPKALLSSIVVFQV